jgi:CubicO group peptidase (beta-lactamase class C family)
MRRNNVATPDDLSWQRLGGGLEASAIDLAQFGTLVMNGSILAPASRRTLWTPPDNRSNYANGWDTGTERCTQFVSKGGAQLGTESYIRLAPSKGIVIVVLTNRDSEGRQASNLGRSIGRVLLRDECGS